MRPEEAGAYIAGYTIFNDWSARDLQLAEMALGLGTCKGKDFANTLGPWIVTADELEPYRSGDRLDLDLRAKVNGRGLGDDTLANMAWSFEELHLLRVARDVGPAWRRARLGHLRRRLPVRACGRHGSDAHPPLGPGDTVELTVEGIGTLTNTVVAGVDPGAAARGPPGPASRPGDGMSDRLPMRTCTRRHTSSARARARAARAARRDSRR